MLCFPSTPKKLLMTVAFLGSGAALFAAGVHLSCVNICPSTIFRQGKIEKEVWEMKSSAHCSKYTCLIYLSLSSLCLSFGLGLNFWCWQFDHSIALRVDQGCNGCECEAMILMALNKHDVFSSYVKIIQYWIFLLVARVAHVSCF